MSLPRRLLLNGGGSGPFLWTAPAPAVEVVASGPYNPAFIPGATVLTQVHCHTTESDGDYTPAEVVAYYAARGYGALALTDHNRTVVQPDGITTKIVGNERSSSSHIIALDIPAGWTTAATSPQSVINAVTSAGGLSEIAHPHWTRGVTLDELRTLTGYLGFEVHNAHIIDGAGANPLTGGSFAVSTWDDVLRTARRNVWGFAVDDSHKIDAFRVYDIGRLRIFGEDDTAASLMTSLSNGNFVADVSNYDVTPGYPDRTDEDLSLSCTGATRIEAYGATGLLSGTDGSSHTHTYDGTETYVRLVAWGDFTEPFDSTSDRWANYNGTFTVEGGVLKSVNGTDRRTYVLRRHREGDFTAQVDMNLKSHAGAGVGFHFHYMGNNHNHLIGLNASYVASWQNRLALSGEASYTAAPLASYPIALATETWYRMKMRYTAVSGLIEAKAWDRDDSEPVDWQISYVGLANLAGMFGLRGNWDTQFDNLYINGFKTYYQPVSIDPA